MANHLKSHIAAHILFFVTILGLTIAYAGEYHAIKEKTSAKITETLACGQCHTMHGTQNNQSMVYGGVAGGNIKLLRHASILQLCLYCHDGNQASMSSPVPPDVWTGGGTGAVTNGASGGALCSGGSSPGNPPCGTTNTNHTVGLATAVTPPGGTVSFLAGEFTCVNCHNPHGTTNYRNLRNSGTYPAGGVDFTGVNVSYRMSSATTTCSDGSATPCYVENDGTAAPPTALIKYQTNMVLFRKATTSNTDGIQGFCRACHTKFHYISTDASAPAEMGGGASGDAGTPWKRHPTMDVSMGEGQTNLHVANSTFWTAALPAWKPRIISQATVATEYPFCLSCHRAHGSTNHSNLIFGNPTSVGGAGTMMRDTCNQCHNQ